MKEGKYIVDESQLRPRNEKKGGGKTLWFSIGFASGWLFAMFTILAR